MKIKELLQESETMDEINNDLMDILTTFKQKGMSKIPMQSTDKDEGLLNVLHKSGFDVKVDDIRKILSKSPFDSLVQRSSATEIELKTSTPDTLPSKSQADKSAEKIDKIAKKVAKKDVKSGEAK